MKKFIIKSIIFIIILYLLAFSLEKIIFFGLKRINLGEFGVQNRIYNGDVNSDIIISGSSRAYVHFNPEIINKITGYSTFNMGMDASGFEFQIPKLKFYLDYNKAPKILIQEVSMDSLNSTSDKIYKPYLYLPYLNNKNLFSGLLKIDKKFVFNKFIPLLNLCYFNSDFQKEMLKSLFFKQSKAEVLPNGYAPRNLKWKKEGDKILLKREKNNSSYKITDKCIKLFQDEIKICKENNIKLILVLPPQYYEIYETQSNREKILTYYKKVSYENNLLFLDYSHIEILKNKKYFYNIQHLNAKGADIFSEIFAKDLDKIIKKDI
jgi:hypothetical protein